MYWTLAKYTKAEAYPLKSKPKLLPTPSDLPLLENFLLRVKVSIKCFHRCGHPM